MVGLGTWTQHKQGEVEEAVATAIRCAPAARAASAGAHTAGCMQLSTLACFCSIGYRHIDCAAEYQNEAEVGRGLAKALRDGAVAREGAAGEAALWWAACTPAWLPAMPRSVATRAARQRLNHPPRRRPTRCAVASAAAAATITATPPPPAPAAAPAPQSCGSPPSWTIPTTGQTGWRPPAGGAGCYWPAGWRPASMAWHGPCPGGQQGAASGCPAAVLSNACIRVGLLGEPGSPCSARSSAVAPRGDPQRCQQCRPAWHLPGHAPCCGHAPEPRLPGPACLAPLHCVLA